MESLRKEVHFVNELPQDYFCPVCTELLTEPFLTDCGHHLCHTCHGRLLAEHKAQCHECQEPYALKDARLNKHLQRLVYGLKVYCKHHKEGCMWKGELLNLQGHLDPKKGTCDYVLIPCSLSCGEHVRSGAMKEHRKSLCQMCQTEGLKRHQLQAHLNECPLQVIPLDFTEPTQGVIILLMILVI